MSIESKKIIATIKKIVGLLRMADERHWFNYFTYVLKLLKKGDHDTTVIRSLSKLFDKNSANSFARVILHHKGNILARENMELEILRKSLKSLVSSSLNQTPQ
ncbi:MAG TPA: hypothetical protein VD770_04850 [Coxiellaceae bacterium]|nr:hypothetical protein [Coxiellaceae bacterium]